MVRSGDRRLSRSFNLCHRYTDDLFLDCPIGIYPYQLPVENANESDNVTNYLDLTFMIESGGKLATRLDDKPHDFDFQIVNFPFLSSNIPSGPLYGVCVSQLKRYARCQDAT